MLAACSPVAPATLAPDASFVCTYTGTWTAGQNTNTAAATVSYTDAGGNTTSPSDSDDANYYGATVSVDVTKEVSVDGGLTWSDANTTPGPTLLSSGAAPQFQITVHNTSNVTVSLTSLTDSSAAFVLAACSPVAPATLAPDASFVCIYTGSWTAGQNTNTAAASVSYTDGGGNTTSPSDFDAANYYGATVSVDVTKEVSVDGGLTWSDANTTPGPTLLSSGAAPQFQITVHNTSNVTVSLTSLTDSSAAFVLAACSHVAPATLAPDASFVCTYTGTWTAGQNTNTAAATVSYTDGGGNTTSPSDFDAANYYGATVSVDVTKAVSVDGGTTWADANDPTGPTLLSSGAAPQFRITVHNTSNVTVSLGTISDSSAAFVLADCTTPVPATLAADASFICIYTGTWTAGQNTNTAAATVSYTDAGGNTTSPSDSDDANYYGAVASISLDKSGTYNGDSVRAEPGDTISYTFTITNTGNVTIHTLVVTDGLITVDCSAVAASLAPGLSTTCSGTYTIDQSDIDAGHVDNTANASAQYVDDAGNTASPGSTSVETVSLPQFPKLSLLKQSTDSPYAHPNDVLHYTFTITNTGNVGIGGPFTISDSRSTNATCPPTPASLAPGEFVICTGTYAVTQADIDYGKVVNTATATGHFHATDITTNTSSVTIYATQSPSIQLTKSASTTSYNAVGQVITYTYTVKNNGNVTLTPPYVTDTNVDAQPQLQSGNANGNVQFDVGESWTFTATHHVTQSDLDSGSVTNSADAYASFTYYGAPASTQIHDGPRSVTVDAVQNATLTLTKDATPNSFSHVGDVLTYTYTLKSTGNVTLDGPVSIDDSNLDPTTTPTLVSGDTNHDGKIQVTETWTFTGHHTITAADIALDQVTNTAIGHAYFRYAGTPAATRIDSAPVTKTVDNHAAELSITKSAAPDPVLVNDNLTYTLTVTNNGPYMATGVKVSDTVPAGTFVSASASQGTGCNSTVMCNLGTIARGASATVTIVVKPTAAGQITNTASVQGDQDDPNMANNSATIVTTANARPTTLLYTGPTTGDYNDVVTVSGKLTDSTTPGPVVGRTITFKLNVVDSCAGTTNSSGIASCDITPSQPAGNYTITATFAGDSVYKTSSTSSPFTVTKEQTTTTYTGSTTPVANGSTVTLSGVLKEDGVSPIVGRTLVLAIGTQSCSATTTTSGSASCNIVVLQALGPTNFSATFNGDTYYLASNSGLKPSYIYASASGGNGAFVIGDQSTTGTVTFWGSQWSSLNKLSGGTAPSAFKGFAKSPATPSCGTTWTTDPGNSAPPPAGPLPAYISVIVASTSSKSGSQISGNVVHIVVVKTNVGYDANPGHPGTGVVVATVC